eukprot:37897-Chlamydomonas_euryale.AAC.5
MTVAAGGGQRRGGQREQTCMHERLAEGPQLGGGRHTQGACVWRQAAAPAAVAAAGTWESGACPAAQRGACAWLHGTLHAHAAWAHCMRTRHGHTACARGMGTLHARAAWAHCMRTRHGHMQHV